MALHLRPVVPDDDPFLFALYAGTRADELADWGWDATTTEVFLRMQFLAQRRHYEAELPGAEGQIVEREGRVVGRLVVLRTDEEIRLADITLLPKARGAGIGTTLIGGLLAEATAAGKPVRLTVARENRARRLYERLGFATIVDDGIRLIMEWTPSAEGAAGTNTTAWNVDHKIAPAPATRRSGA